MNCTKESVFVFWGVARRRAPQIFLHPLRYYEIACSTCTCTITITMTMNNEPSLCYENAELHRRYFAPQHHQQLLLARASSYAEHYSLID